MRKGLYPIWIGGAFLLLLLLAAGCRNGTVVHEAASIEGGINQAEEDAKRQERDSQSLWFVIDDKGAKIRLLSDGDPEVMAVHELIGLHSKVVDNFDYRTLKAEAEFSYYADGFKQKLREEGYPEALRRMYADNGIVMKLGQLAWYEIAFHEDFKTARVKTESELVIEQCAQSYLDKSKLKRGQTYVQPRIVDLVKEGSEWKIARIDKGPFVEKQSAPVG
ncbi:hypothetical protein SAMN05216312_11257 [Cohnella sp. OV330]|uniref:hypothetical protein n=1 Tax=Cohnella sp. OV330 TaxID=1855288 RepID=UPI0008EC4BA4|nr:hypothetical protein [Cohnella sp. OV330]SFB53794.1 hypothetical protein SAMN05216312_11257 [Cohnella sp. OV330]